MPTSSKVKI